MRTRKTVIVMIRLSGSQRELLEFLAKAEGRTLSGFCRELLRSEADKRAPGFEALVKAKTP